MRGVPLASAIIMLMTTFQVWAAPDLIVHNAKVTTFDDRKISAFAVENGKFVKLSGRDREILSMADDDTVVVNAEGRRVTPGINDSHTHVVRGGRFYNLETRWEGIRSLKEALAVLAQQAARTPEGHWVRVIGGWSPYQFEEKRMPTIEELNAAAPDTPVFVLHLYSSGILNQAGLDALGITPATKAPEGSRFELDATGRLTGMLLAEPNPMILYRTIAALPPMDPTSMLNSSQQFYQRLLSLGMTSAIDAGGGGHLFPNDYSASTTMAIQGELPMRVSQYLFPQAPGQEFATFSQWMENYKQNQNLHMTLHNGYVIEGGGELLVWSASDYENFRADRPELKAGFEDELEKVVRLHALKRWPFRIHATYDESISRMLTVLEKVNEAHPLTELRWAFDHAETISDENLLRVKALGGGIAIQGRMAFAGEDFLERYGKKVTERSPPMKRILELGIPMGLGTDGTRVSSFNPWPTYYWAVSGRTVGGERLYKKDNRLSRLNALKAFSQGSAWFSGEDQFKGAIAEGFYADFAILNHDIFEVKERDLLDTYAEMTVVDGKIRYATSRYSAHETPKFEALPKWSPVNIQDYRR